MKLLVAIDFSELAEKVIAEAEKLGFEKIIVSRYNKKSFDPKAYKIQVLALSRVDEVYQQLF